MAAGVKRYQPRALNGFMGVLGVMVTHQGVVFGMEYERRCQYIVRRHRFTLDHFPVVHGARIAGGHGMHRVQHFLRHLFLDGSELAVYLGGDAHQVQDCGLHEFGNEPVRVVGLLNEANDADIKSGFVAPDRRLGHRGNQYERRRSVLCRQW